MADTIRELPSTDAIVGARGYDYLDPKAGRNILLLAGFPGAIVKPGGLPTLRRPSDRDRIHPIRFSHQKGRNAHP